MREKKVYIAFDGGVFDTAAGCIEYEIKQRDLRLIKMLSVQHFDISESDLFSYGDPERRVRAFMITNEIEMDAINEYSISVDQDSVVTVSDIGKIVFTDCGLHDDYMCRIGTEQEILSKTIQIMNDIREKSGIDKAITISTCSNIVIP